MSEREPVSENEAPSTSPVPPRTRLTNFALGMWWSRAIYVAAELRIADHLADEPKDVDALAELTGTHAPSLYRLLRFLTGLGVFAEVGPRIFAQSSLSEYLRSDLPDSARDEILMLGRDWHWHAWGALGHTVRTGQTAVDYLFGEDLFAYFAHQNPEAGLIFRRYQSSSSHEAIVEAYDFSGFGTLVDIGGGYGRLLTAIVEANPSVHCVLFDRAEVIEDVRMRRTELGVDERIELVSGDFFRGVPPADAYVLQNIIHDWSDEECGVILHNCRNAMRGAGRIVVLEQVVPEWNEWSSIKFGDLEMLVLVHGRERTASEFQTLFEAAGLELRRILPTASELKIIEGVAS